MSLLDAGRVVKNVCAIGSSVCVTSFGFSVATSNLGDKKLNTLNYELRDEEPEEIHSIEDIEDLERIRGCKFLFWKGEGETKFKQGDFHTARKFSSENNNALLGNLIDQFKGKCQKGSFVFITTHKNPIEATGLFEKATNVPA